MRNLVLLCRESYRTGCETINSVKIDTKNNGISFGVCANEVFRIRWREKQIDHLFHADTLLDAEYLMLSGDICAAKISGEILLWNSQSQKCDEVGFCGDNISSMSWSPDQEIVLFTTESSKIIVMDSLFDIIEEVNLLESDFGEKEFVVLGWGKKETQFHGSAGKRAAQKKENPELLGNIFSSEETSNKINVAWRGDGEYFAVNFFRDNSRLFKVFNREGKLQFTSEKCSGLESAVAWKPTGLWISIPQVLPDKYVIALFEKNGLRHQELILPFKRDEEVVKSLKWSSDSVVLAIETVRKTTSSSNIYLYTMGNYNWYLKQCLQFDGLVRHFDWDSSLYEWKSLHVLLHDGTYHVYKWDYDVNCSLGQTQFDESVVSVINGSNVLLTNFRGVVIPPPMCAFTLTNKHYINSVGFIQHPQNPSESNKFFTVDDQQILKFYECEFTDSQSPMRQLKACTEIEELGLKKWIKFPNHIHWLTDNILIVEFEQKKPQLSIFKKEDGNAVWGESDRIELKDHTVGLTSCDESSLVVTLLDKSILKVKIANGKFETVEEVFSLPEFCEKTTYVRFDGVEKIFSLRNRQMLYLNGDKYQPDVTSFFIAHPFLIFTTVDELKIVNLINMNIDTVRKTERGAKIVSIVPKHDRTILQMPRGNLETIQPRALTLRIIGDLLDKNEYRMAYEILRKQRINLNLIVDHNPKEFLEKIDVFLSEITNPSWLNLFFTDLQPEDVTETIYEGSYRTTKRQYPDNYSIEKKVTLICGKMCEKMEERSEKRFTLPIITSFVKRNDIESALKVIWVIRCTEKSTSNNSGDFSESEDALNYLLYLVDVNKLFDIALGMYDFKIVLFVAEKSQKDPKEYIAHLNELNELEEFYKRYKIDVSLKRYERALENISKCPKHFEECMKLIKDQCLHSKALLLFPPDSQEFREIAQAYAENLRFKGLLEEASLMYERAGNLEEAIQTAKNTVDYNRCLSLKKKSGASDEDLAKLASSLIPSMKENCMFWEAADLIKTYMKNSSQVIETLLDGKLYMAALYELYEVKSCDYSLDYIRNHLLKYIEVLVDCMQSDKSQFVTYKMRLGIVRQRRLDQPDDVGDHFDDCDLYSDITSVKSTKYTGSSSRGSSNTFKSSKSRRKHKRKLLSLKEGNPFEDVALIDALYNLISKCFGQQGHIKEISRAAIALNLDEMGKNLQVIQIE
ncbi:Elongator complex protein 1 [Sergentomyia squamirostris]